MRGQQIASTVVLFSFLVVQDRCFAFHVPQGKKSSSPSNIVEFKHRRASTIKNKNVQLEPRDTIYETTLFSNNMDQVDDEKEIAPWVWFVTLVLPLQLVYVSNQWSRSSINYLVNFAEDADPFRAMNLDIGFSEAQYGLLASLAFTALFAVASLGAGIASDRYNRKNLTVIGAIGWSIATLGTSLSSTYSEVLAWRVAMGLACAFATPTAYTLINERVPKDKASFATSLYGTGVAFGGALASLSILLDNEFG